ncbi:MAG TPA: hypothetical protein VIZ87_06010 [Terrimicrobium sp.]
MATLVRLSAKPVFAMLVSLSPEPPAKAAVTMVLSVATSPSMEVTHREHHAHVNVTLPKADIQPIKFGVQVIPAGSCGLAAVNVA